ncbi:MAG TPA: N-acetyltransferase [Verrucomicrobiales bacterium]|nr:N-acetyltransferase [Verrucomicrobiales bacterium]HIL70757.1 N-acetyltransferase [Verrucomicrobiota bacterium]
MFTIRQSELDDCEAVFVLAKQFASSFAVERAAFDKSYTVLQQSSDAYLGVAADGGRVVGYVLGFDHYTFFANGRVSWLEEIMVSEDSRRCGIGRRLMDSFESWAKVRSSKLVALATRRAASFYFSIGYEESATYFRKLL